MGGPHAPPPHMTDCSKKSPCQIGLALMPGQILNYYYTITLTETVQEKPLMKYGYLGKMTKCSKFFIQLSENEEKKLTRSWEYFEIKIL